MPEEESAAPSELSVVPEVVEPELLSGLAVLESLVLEEVGAALLESVVPEFVESWEVVVPELVESEGVVLELVESVPELLSGLAAVLESVVLEEAGAALPVSVVLELVESGEVLVPELVESGAAVLESELLELVESGAAVPEFVESVLEVPVSVVPLWVPAVLSVDEVPLGSAVEEELLGSLVEVDEVVS